MALTVVDGGMLSATNAQYTMFKNRLINGNMGIWQRGTTGTAAGYAYPSVDRWAGGPFSLYQVLSQNTSVPTGVAQYSLKVQRTVSQTSTAAILAMQTIESSNCYDLSGQTVTVSFWAKAGANFSAAGSSLGIQLNTGTTADQGGSTYYTWAGSATPISIYQTITTTWTKYTFTGTFGAGVLEAALVFFYTPVGTAGADDAFYITGVQLEKGSTATAFDYRPYTTELQLCQRYFEAIGSVSGGGGYAGFAFGTGTSTTLATCLLNWMVPKRTLPTFSYNTLGNFCAFSSTWGSPIAATAINSLYAGSNSVVLQVSVASGLTTGSPSGLGAFNNTNAQLYLSAEL